VQDVSDAAPANTESLLRRLFAPLLNHWNKDLSKMALSDLVRKFGVSPLPVPPAWYALPLRLIVGLGFMQHGYAKLARGPDDFIAILHAMGVPFPDLLGSATICVELVGGILLLAGAYIPIAAIPMIIVLLVAILTVHIPNGFSSIKLLGFDQNGAHFGQPGYETDLLYIAGLMALCFGGAGPLSVDSLLKRKMLAGSESEPPAGEPWCDESPNR
jgi:putative oxidoreductase